MKFMITVLAIIFTSTSFASCCHNSNEGVGTIAGVIAGGLLGSTIGKGTGQIVAIAAGSIAGGILGGNVGRNMDRNDRYHMMGALERNPIGQPAYWSNRHTGVEYEVVPVRNVRIEGNNYCREYRTVANIGGKSKEVFGTACRQPDGSWRAIS